MLRSYSFQQIHDMADTIIYVFAIQHVSQHLLDFISFSERVKREETLCSHGSDLMMASQTPASR